MSWLGIDWSQVWYPGPRRPFSADEMARGGSEAPGPTAVMVALANLLTLAVLAMAFAPAGQRGRTAVAFGVLTMLGAAGIRWLWWRPWRQPLMQASMAVVLVMAVAAVAVRALFPDRDERLALAVVLAGGGALLPLLFWFLVIYRAQQIDSRLRELAEREKAIEMARRLATAQLEPHFLFNTLASVQHWVQTQDDRAAPLLAALTGYLRATLPLFNRPLLALHEELNAVQQYLRVMQLRMGARLAWRVDVPQALQALMLPPGVLLTLVENAIVHGLEPTIAGGTLLLSARGEGGQALIDLHDDGAGASAGFSEGVGLANVRERLRLAFGERATLTLTTPPAGGFSARLRLPLTTP